MVYRYGNLHTFISLFINKPDDHDADNLWKALFNPRRAGGVWP